MIVKRHKRNISLKELPLCCERANQAIFLPAVQKELNQVLEPNDLYGEILQAHVYCFLSSHHRIPCCKHVTYENQ